MFHVWDISGVQRTYSPGIIRRLRSVDPANPSAAIEPIAHETEHPAFKIAESRYRQTSTPERRKALCAKDIMTAPVTTVTPSTPMSRVNDLMIAKRYRHIPVVSDSNCPVGMISDRDVLKFNISSLQNNHDLSAASVLTCMAHHVLTSQPQAEIHEVVRVMFNERVGAMPIVDSNGQIQGIITRSDILRALINQGTLELWV